MPPPLCPPPASRLARRVRALIYEEEEGASGRAVIINFSLSLSLSLRPHRQQAKAPTELDNTTGGEVEVGRGPHRARRWRLWRQRRLGPGVWRMGPLHRRRCDAHGAMPTPPPCHSPRFGSVLVRA